MTLWMNECETTRGRLVREACKEEEDILQQDLPINYILTHHTWDCFTRDEKDTEKKSFYDVSWDRQGFSVSSSVSSLTIGLWNREREKHKKMKHEDNTRHVLLTKKKEKRRSFTFVTFFPFFVFLFWEKKQKVQTPQTFSMNEWKSFSFSFRSPVVCPTPVSSCFSVTVIVTREGDVSLLCSLEVSRKIGWQ